MAEVKNLSRLLRKLERMEREAHRKYSGNVVVGYAASYALVVHEKPPSMAKHKPGKQWKYLEQPAREEQDGMRDELMAGLHRGLTMEQALIKAGLYLQRKSQQIVPILTGNLRGSAFTEKE